MTGLLAHWVEAVDCASVQIPLLVLSGLVFTIAILAASSRRGLAQAGLEGVVGGFLRWTWLGFSLLLLGLGLAGGWIWSATRPQAEAHFAWQGSWILVLALLVLALFRFVAAWRARATGRVVAGGGAAWLASALTVLVLGVARGMWFVPLEAHGKPWKAKVALWGEMIGHPLAQNGLTCLLVLGAGYLVWVASGLDYWRLAWAQVRTRRLAMASLRLLVACGAVAALDSVGWSDPALAEDGTPRRDVEGKLIYSPVRFTALDRALAPLRTRTERSFSAPLARAHFDPVTETGPDGVARSTRPPLAHPGAHLFGTDRVGDDVLFRAIKGIRTALVIGIVPTLLATPLAMAFGISAGYFGRRWDDLVQFLYTLLSSIPDILLMVTFMLLFEKGLAQLCIALGITSWVGLCRLLRGETLKLRELEYVQAARALGGGHIRVMARHLAPNLMHIVLINAVLRFSGMVLAEAVLTYLHIGVDPVKTPSWGRMINMAQYELARDPVIWWSLAAAFAFMLVFVLAANLFGDAVRDALDPRLKKAGAR